MKIIYATLNNTDEARKIGKDILEKRLANCANYFPITCIYNYENQVTEEPEVVLIVKTADTTYDRIESLIKSHIDYDNFIGQFQVSKVNSNFEAWLDSIVK